MPSRRRRLPTEPIVSTALKDSRKIPASLDWRECGFVTPPVNQQNCGSCYAYSIAESIEGQIFKQTGMLLSVSAQQLVDCSTAIGNLGCTGGSLRTTLKYLEKSKGLMATSMYPYNGEVRIALCQLSSVRHKRYSVEAPFTKRNSRIVFAENHEGSCLMSFKLLSRKRIPAFLFNKKEKKKLFLTIM